MCKCETVQLCTAYFRYFRDGLITRYKCPSLLTTATAVIHSLYLASLITGHCVSTRKILCEARRDATDKAIVMSCTEGHSCYLNWTHTCNEQSLLPHLPLQSASQYLLCITLCSSDTRSVAPLGDSARWQRERRTQQRIDGENACAYGIAAASAGSHERVAQVKEQEKVAFLRALQARFEALHL